MVTRAGFALASIVAIASASPIWSSVRQANSSHSSIPYSLPDNSPDPAQRAAAISTTRATFIYGAPVGGGPYFPNGTLGATLVTRDENIVVGELQPQTSLIADNVALAKAHADQYNGLQTLDDYTKLYDGIWQSTSAPTGQASGMLTNYTQDLLFSMERLSINPFSVSRLDPSANASLPFVVSDAIVMNLTGQTLNKLYAGGRLFYVDYRAQGALPASAQYSPASDAYFYIHPVSGQFLPLAIRTNVGSNLIYTPADSPTDWLLAKIMYNTNDFFFGQFHHFANTHYVADVVYQAAIRTLSVEHPVLAILARLMYGEFGIRPLAAEVLLSPGGEIDQFFGRSGAGAAIYATDLYSSGYAGAIQNNYFYTNLERRGLIGCAHGPALQSFPYFDDAQQIFIALSDFTATFVSSYYASDAAVAQDTELQAWVREATGPAEAIDFPATLQTRAALAALLAHMAHLVSTAHHAVNLNQLATTSGVLPFHPSGLYQPVPAAKGVTDIVPFLPSLNQTLGLLQAQADFARPLLAGTNRTLANMFNDAPMLARMNPATRAANTRFMAAMATLSDTIGARTFDADGLSQGMPFVWQGLDPNVVPWSTTI